MPSTFKMQKKPTIIKATVPLENAEPAVYNEIMQILRDFNQGPRFSGKTDYEEGLTFIANNLYLLYERLYLNIVREIDYTDIKNFAVNNDEFVKDIFKTHFPKFSIQALDTWTQVHLDILECAMYRNSNKHNKHVYH
jgi:hypothetical protein